MIAKCDPKKGSVVSFDYLLRLSIFKNFLPKVHTTLANNIMSKCVGMKINASCYRLHDLFLLFF